VRPQSIADTLAMAAKVRQRDARLTVRVDRAELERFAQVASRQERSVSAEARIALRRHLATQERAAT
jgi:hypothetical protein